MLVFGLFSFEDKSIELLLKCLVCIVDADLFEGICVKGLEAKDVQDSDGAHFIDPVIRPTNTLNFNRFVYSCDNVSK